MITALDSSVILDVVLNDPVHAESSEEALRRAQQDGRLIICECVAAEIRPAFRNDQEFEQLQREWSLDFMPSSLESARLAGSLFSEYLKRGGKGGRIVADFLIGAHAQCHAERLLARDRGYLRDYFSDLLLMTP